VEKGTDETRSSGRSMMSWGGRGIGKGPGTPRPLSTGPAPRIKIAHDGEVIVEPVRSAAPGRPCISGLVVGPCRGGCGRPQPGGTSAAPHRRPSGTARANTREGKQSTARWRRGGPGQLKPSTGQDHWGKSAVFTTHWPRSNWVPARCCCGSPRGSPGGAGGRGQEDEDRKFFSVAGAHSGCRPARR